MKKKVALLLALVMTLSLLPMNVFGNPVAFPGGVEGWLTNNIAPGAVAGQEDDWLRDVTPGNPDGARTFVAPITLQFPLSNLAGRAVQGVDANGDPEWRVPLQINLENALIFNGDARGLAGGWWTGGAMGTQFRNAQLAGPSGSDFDPDEDFNVGIGGAWEYVNVPWYLPTTTQGALTVEGVRAEITGISTDWHSMGRGFVSVITDRQITSADTGTISFTIPVRGFVANDAWLTSSIQLITADGQLVLIPQRGLAGLGLRSVAWSATPRGFSSALHVPNIRLSENQFGVIEGNDLVIRLVAPQFYSWSFGGEIPVVTDGNQGHIVGGRPGHSGPLEIVRGGVGNGLSFQPVSITRVEANRLGATGIATGQHELFIVLGNVNRNEAWRPGTGWLEIANLWLVPDGNAAAQGNVNIRAELGRFTNFTTTGNFTQIHRGMTATQLNNQLSPGTAFVGAGGNDNFLVYAIQGTGVQVFRRVYDNAWFNANGGLITPAPTNVVGVLDTVMGSGWTGRNFERVQANRIMHAGQVVESLHVGTRGASGLSVEVYDGPNNVRTGHLGTWRNANNNADLQQPSGVTTWMWNRDNEGLAHWSGVQTSTLIIEENIAGAFSVGFGSPINFEFLDENGNPHPGIRLLGMEARAGNNQNHEWTRGQLSNFHRSLRGVPGDGLMPGNNAWPGANQNWMTFSGWLSALDQRLPNVAGVGRLTDTMATIYLPSQTITDVPNPGILEVRFWLSVEAGYEWKNGPEIDVTISGAGVTNMAQEDRVQTVALAQDPIVVTHAETAIQLETGALYNVVGRQAISDITIDVVNNAAFGIGQEIWLYIGTDTPGRNMDLNISNIPTLSVNAESGLRFDTGRLGNPAFTRAGRDAIVFTVTRQPYGGDAPAPVITISNLAVDGQAWPGIDYHLVVSGTGVANNDQEVFHRLTDVNAPIIGAGFVQADAAQMRFMNRGVFTTMPYFATTLVQASGGIGEIITGPGGVGAGAGSTLTLNRFIPIDVNGEMIVPLLFSQYFNAAAGRNYRVAKANPRVFADFIGGDMTYEAGTATFTGLHQNGTPMTVALTVGSPNAVVNGQTVNIAAVAGQPQLAIVPVIENARMFVPARFLTNTFGIEISFAGEGDHMDITFIR